MNDGYLFVITGVIVLILLWTHWFDFCWEKNVSRNRMWTSVLVALIMLGALLEIPVTEQTLLNVGAMVLSFFIFAYYIWIEEHTYRLQLLSVVLFLGLFYVLAYQLFAMDPVLMILSPTWMLPLFFTFFIVLTGFSIQQQWIMLLGGFVLGECLQKALFPPSVTLIQFGDAGFRDELAIGFVLIFLVWISVDHVVKGYEELLKHIRFPNKEEG